VAAPEAIATSPALTSTTGRVIDAAGKPVRGASISVEGGPALATTDRDGKFIVQAAEGASLVIEAPGFGIGLATAGQTDDVVLFAESQVAETIEIKGEVAPTTQGSAKLSRDQIERIPGTGNDMIRSLQAMPGVASYPLPLGSSGVVIRGSSPQD